MTLRVYIDSDVILDLVSGVEEKPIVDTISAALDNGALICVCSELAIVETLVHAVRTKNLAFESAVRGFLASSPKVALIPISAQVLELSLQLRSSFKSQDTRRDSHRYRQTDKLRPLPDSRQGLEQVGHLSHNR